MKEKKKEKIKRVSPFYDEDQKQRAPEAQAQAQPMISSPTMPQRITMSIAKTLGDGHQLMSLFVISFE